MLGFRQGSAELPGLTHVLLFYTVQAHCDALRAQLEGRGSGPDWLEQQKQAEQQQQGENAEEGENMGYSSEVGCLFLAASTEDICLLLQESRGTHASTLHTCTHTHARSKWSATQWR